MEKKNACDGKCLKCDFCKIVPDPDMYDSFIWLREQNTYEEKID